MISRVIFATVVLYVLVMFAAAPSPNVVKSAAHINSFSTSQLGE